MKLKRIFVLAMMVGIMLFSGMPYAAANTVNSIVFVKGVNEYFVNNHTPGIKMDAAPFIENGRTLVPVRFLCDALGVQVMAIPEPTDNSQVRITMIDSIKGFARVTTGDNILINNGLKINMDVAPKIIPPGRTVLPARYIAEAFGYNVDWQDDKYIVIWPKEAEKTSIDPVKDFVEGRTNEKAEGTAGYTIPKGTELEIEFPKDGKYELIVKFDINGPAYPTDSKLKDFKEIMLGKFEERIVNNVIAYIKMKTSADYGFPIHPYDSAGQNIYMVSPAGTTEIEIKVERPEFYYNHLDPFGELLFNAKNKKL